MESVVTPSGLSHIWLIAKYEFTKRFTNKSGMVALIAFMLIWTIILLYPVKGASEIMMQPSMKDLVSGMFGSETLNQLFDWEVAEFAIYWVIALYIFPLFSIFIAADQFSSDKQRGTLRYLSLRVSRSNLYFGRFLGHLFIQISLIVLTLLATTILAITRDSSLTFAALSTSCFLLINLLITILPFIAAMTLLSLYANTARKASIFAIVIWVVLLLITSALVSQFPILNMISWILPGSQISDIINSQGLASLAHAHIPLLQTVLLLTLGKFYINRSSL